MTTIPFSLGHVWAGFAEGHGMLRGDGPDLVIEYQIKDSLFGVLRGAPKTLRLPLTQIDSVSLRKGWFGGRTLVLQAKSLAAVAAIPTAEKGCVEFKIAKCDRAAAEQFVERAYE